MRRRDHQAQAAMVVGVLLLAGCSSMTTGAGHTAGAASHGTPGEASTAAVVTTSPAAGSGAINPAVPVSVSIAHGTLTSVTMTNPAGKVVTGALVDGGRSWHTTEDLGYGKTYSIVVRGTSEAGAPVTKQESLATLTPAKQTMPYLQRIGGYALTSGGTYGVAVVPVVHFDESITNKKAAEQALSVTTSPHVDGSWYWADDSNVHWRPQAYWPAGTQVTITAKVYGVEVGNGMYGQSDVSTHFTIGRKQLTVADDNSPQIDKVRVYDSAGTVLRTMNTSMGKHGGTRVNGHWINFYTLDGTYTVLEHDNPAIMSSESYGLPVQDGGYAPFPVPYSTKISIDGIYLHEYNSTIREQNSGQDVSEGCLNLQTSDAAWFYEHSLDGDPVEVNGAHGAPEITVAQGGDWSVPWTMWLAGSALN